MYPVYTNLINASILSHTCLLQKIFSIVNRVDPDSFSYNMQVRNN